ncbi:MAG: hypothetical protein AAGH76_08760 [Pseudomonadota bacterium]
MDKTKNLYRALSDSTATEQWLESDLLQTRVLFDDQQPFGSWEMAVAFFHGADSLREQLQEQHQGYDLFRREYPMMFLYRHALELFLKHALQQPAHGHSLANLLNLFVVEVQERYDEDISRSWFVTEIRELSEIDPIGQSFRYSSQRDGKPALTSAFFLDLEDLGKRMFALYSVSLHMGLAGGAFTRSE